MLRLLHEFSHVEERQHDSNDDHTDHGSHEYEDEWFEHGVPTGRFGDYTDMSGIRRNIFSDEWVQYTPQVRDVRKVSEWGWDVTRDIIKKDWGWDVSGWTMPEAYRGGFYGFIGKDCDGLH